MKMISHLLSLHVSMEEQAENRRVVMARNAGLKLSPLGPCGQTARKNTFTSQHRILSRAFTLVEIMIAVAILGMILGAVYASWSAILRGSKIGQEAAAEAQRSRIAMRVLEDALVSTELFTENLQHYAFVTDTSGDFALLSVAAHLSKSFPGSGVFGDQVVRRVTFSVELGNAGNQLVMTQRPLLAATNATEDQSYSVPLARNISAFNLEFWDTNKHEWAGEWKFTNQLPKLVRVTLGFGRASQYFSRPKEIITRNVAMAATAIPREFQVPGVGGAANIRTNLGSRPGNPQLPNVPRNLPIQK